MMMMMMMRLNVSCASVCLCVFVRCYHLSVKMPSRVDTLQWLGDDVTSLSDKVSDILKLDVSITASTPVRQEQEAHPDVAFSDSFSPGGFPSDVDAQRPAVDVDAVSDAVGSLSIAAGADDDRNISSPVADASAEPVALDAGVNGAVGGTYNHSLLSMLAQFTDDAVCCCQCLCRSNIYIAPIIEGRI